MQPYGATRPQWVNHVCAELYNSSPPSAAYASVNGVNIGSDNGLSPIRRQAII